MGNTTSVGFIQSSLSVSSFVLLAWTVIALVYPLFASIIAISKDSKDQMRNVVMYWTLFSLFSLIEIAFVKIFGGIPYWSSVRLVVICCLVMPQFKGACLAYQGLARTVLSVRRLCKRKRVLDVVKDHIEENGTEALETRIAVEHESQKKLINLQSDTKIREQEGEDSAAASKQHESQKRIDLQRDTKITEQEGENSSATSKQVQHTESVSVARDLTGSFAAAEFTDTMPPNETAEKGCPETPLFKKAQQEWTTSSVITHATIKLKDKEPSPSATIKLKDGNVAEKLIKDSGSEGKLIASKTKRGECSSSHRNVQVVKSKEKKGPAASQQYANAEVRETSLPKALQELRRDLYMVRGTSEDMLNTQLRGSKLESKFESLKTSKDGGFPKWCTVCDVKLHSDDNVVSHFKGKKHISNMKLSQKNGET